MLRRLILGLLVAAIPALAGAQPLQNFIVPTAPAGTSNNQAASTAFVQNAAGAAASINIKTFGAVGNGSADDTAAIQAAETARAAACGNLLFPPGTYKITFPISINRACGGSWNGYGAVLRAGTSGFTFAILSGAVAGPSAKTFGIYGLEFDANAQFPVSAISETKPYQTVIKDISIVGGMQFAAVFTGDSATATQYGFITIDGVNQVGSGEWFFRGADTTHWLFNVNISNFNQQGTGVASWAGANSLFYFFRTVSANITNVNAASLDAAAIGYTIQGDSEGIFITNSIVGLATTGLVSLTDGSAFPYPSFVYLVNAAFDQPVVSGLVTAGAEAAWRMTNVNVTNGSQRTNTGPGMDLAAANTDFDMTGVRISSMQRTGLLVRTGANGIRMRGMYISGNNVGAVGGQFDVDLQASTTANVRFDGYNIIGTTNGQVALSRVKLAAALTLFADFVNGNDSNTCLAAGAGNACKTVNGAYNKLVANYDTAGQAVTISFNNDDSTGLSLSTAWSGGGQLTIQGPGGSPPSVGFTSSVAINVAAPLPAQLNLVGFKMSGGTYGILFTSPGVITINNLNFGAESSVQASIQSSGSKLVCNGSYTISGGSIAHWQAVTGGAVNCVSVTITLTGTPAFTVFAASDTLAQLFVPGLTFSGSATGLRYNATVNGVIATNSGGANYFPGNAAGITSFGGQYQ